MRFDPPNSADGYKQIDSKQTSAQRVDPSGRDGAATLGLGRSSATTAQPIDAPSPPGPDPTFAVKVSGLYKSFGDKVAVDGISFEVQRGTFFGLLGPNGAGKSTTLSMITGLLRPDYGNIWVDGVETWTDPVEVKHRIGVVPETLLLFERLTGSELLEYVGMLRGLTSDQVARRSAELLAVLELDEDSNKMIVDYSQGMRKKISLAAALMHVPRVLFLDEPFESVDPIAVRTIQALLRQFVNDGATVVFSSHVMATVEDLCENVAIMHNGKIVVSGQIGAVAAKGRLEDVFAEAVGANEYSEGTLDWLRQGRTLHIQPQDGRY